MKLDRHSSIPLYYQLKEFIREKIDEGEYPPGGKIPSELEFCESLDLSRPTVRQAISDLVSEGVLNIIKGKGTFVIARDAVVEIKGYNPLTFSFFSLKETAASGIIRANLVAADEEDKISEYFNDENIGRDGFVCVERLLKEKDQVYGFVESYIPVSMYPSLVEDIREGKSLMDITVNKYAYLPVKGKNEFFVAPARDRSSRVLDLARGTPLLCGKVSLTSRSELVCEVMNIYLRSDISKLSF